MNRLTFKKWFEFYKPDEETTTASIKNHTQITEQEGARGAKGFYLVGDVIDKLAAYEDAEEAGLLYRMPCKSKQIVYILDPNLCQRIHRPFKCEVDEFVIDGKSCFAVLNACEHYYAMRRFKAVNIDNFGKTVFLTSEEATAAFRTAQEGE